MKAIIPVAGQGTRLRPITNEIPKPLIEVAGKPVLAHILDNMTRSSIDELVLIVNDIRDPLTEWVEKYYSDKLKIYPVRQDEALGLGHAISCAGDHLEGEILISLGDEIFAREYASMIDEIKSSNDITASIGVKTVSDPSHYGMVTYADDGRIGELVEKPPIFDGDQAIAGVYYIKQGELLRTALDEIMKRPFEGKEYQLTDALQWMIKQGHVFRTFQVGEYFDCGRLITILDSNKRLIKSHAKQELKARVEDTEIIQPCIVSDDATIRKSKIGPYVSIGSGAVIDNCTLTNVIVSQGTSIDNTEVSDAVIANTGILSLTNGND